MSIRLTLSIADRELPITEYSTLDINRQGNNININITNDKQDFAFNAIFDQIQASLGSDKPFEITAKQEKGETTFTNMTANYYLSTQSEILHFTNINPEVKNPE